MLMNPRGQPVAEVPGNTPTGSRAFGDDSVRCCELIFDNDAERRACSSGKLTYTKLKDALISKLRRVHPDKSRDTSTNGHATEAIECLGKLSESTARFHRAFQGSSASQARW